MAHKKAGGSTALGRSSQPKYLGVKIYGGQPAKAGEVIIRQRGTKFHSGKNVKRGGDDTLYATDSGTVKFEERKIKTWDGCFKKKKFVSVV